MPSKSAGILAYRKRKRLEVLLVHPGGPFFKNKDAGAWSVPKGEFLDDEEPLAAAKREFEEETGQAVSGKFIPLGSVKLKSGKIVHAWAVEGEIDHETIVSNTFEIEWPPRSGKKIMVPEIDRAGWFNLTLARQKINEAQTKFIDKLASLI